MKLSDLKVGEEYAFAHGKQDKERLYNPLRCILLSTEPCYNTDWRYPHKMINETGLDRLWTDYGVIWGRQPKQYERGRNYMPLTPRARVAVAVELPTYTKMDIDPITGLPWYRTQWDHRDPYEWVETGTVWVPYAAYPSELRKPWSEVAPIVAAEKQQRALMNKGEHARAAAQKVENERKAVEQRARTAAGEKERATRSEYYERHVAPLLVEAGVDLDADVQFSASSTFTNIKTEALAKLLAALQEGAEQ